MERGIDISNSQQNYDPRQGNNYLLAIGVDRYQHWTPLDNAVKDAKDLIQVLTQQYQFDEEHITTLFDERATEANIYDAIRELKRQITPQDNLLVYYSGHGHYDEDFDEGHWIPVDARTDTEDRFISNSNIIKRINAIDAHHVLLIIDSCFSGSLVVKKRNTSIDEHFRSRRIISSGRLETVSDGAPGQNSPFASGVITYLKRNTKRAVNTTALVQYVKEFIAGKARQTPVDGRIQNSADEGGEFIFHLKVSEEDFWGNVQEKDTVQAYQNYLEYYPTGQYATQAERRLLALKEEDVWRSAKAKDNELAYKNYLQKYAGAGKYLEEAKQRLDALQSKHQERRQLLEELAQKDAEREDIQQQFQQRIKEAEALFSQKKLEQARDLYRESLHYYMEGFAPNYEYIEQQINFCSHGITFLQHFQNGEEAMKQGNYRLAIQYFNEAAKSGDDPKIEDLIRVCRQRLARPAAPAYSSASGLMEEVEDKQRSMAGTVGTSRVARPAQPKSRRWVRWTIGLGAVVVILIGIAVIQEEMAYQDEYTPSPYTEEQGTELLDEGSSSYSETYQEPATAPAGNAEKILGSWRVTDLRSNGVSIRQMGIEYQQSLDLLSYTFTFYNNGTAMLASTVSSEYQNYYLSGNAITIASPYWGNSNGTIEQLDGRSMRITFIMPDGYGGTYPMTIYFQRF
ncbi:MAG: caspase family protein [Phaeodactylibacter sp.]|nr:caspase family protein [Phaeodactylibacter sp.]MCB9054022.1 caspase family protein [Lewinellaceae bacterium]